MAEWSCLTATWLNALLEGMQRWLFQQRELYEHHQRLKLCSQEGQGTTYFSLQVVFKQRVLTYLGLRVLTHGLC